jgi:hypothetical protein
MDDELDDNDDLTQPPSPLVQRAIRNFWMRYYEFNPERLRAALDAPVRLPTVP